MRRAVSGRSQASCLEHSRLLRAPLLPVCAGLRDGEVKVQRTDRLSTHSAVGPCQVEEALTKVQLLTQSHFRGLEQRKDLVINAQPPLRYLRTGHKGSNLLEPIPRCERMLLRFLIRVKDGSS